MNTSSPRDIARDFAYMMFARGVALMVGFARSLVVPGLLGPHAYGMWKTLGLIETYVKFGEIGARAALRREGPYYTGKNDAGRLAAVRDVAFTANNLAVLIAATGTVVAAFLIDDPALRVAMLVFLPLLYFQHIYAFMELYLFGHKEFAYQSRVNAWMNVLEAILAVTLTYVFGLTGLVIGTAASYSIASRTAQAHGFAVGLRWRWPVFRELVVVGFPPTSTGCSTTSSCRSTDGSS